mgnify:CR=1 FL=1
MSVYAILKCSYHWERDFSSNDPSVHKPIAVGGFLGSAFFLNDHVAITAYHVLNEESFFPEAPHNNVQIWMVSELGTSFEIKVGFIESYPHLDISIIRFIVGQIGANIFELDTDFIVNTEIKNEGYPDFGPPNIQLKVAQLLNETPKLAIESADLRNSLFNKSGNIKSIEKESVNKNDIKLNNIEIIRTNYGGKKGMSGSPLVKISNGKVIGVMSHGYPEDIVDKEELCAISVNEFIHLI